MTKTLSRFAVTISLTLAVFGISFLVPRGVSYGLFYLAVLLLAITLHSRVYIWRLAVFMMVLRTLGFLLQSTSAEERNGVALVNLMLSLFAIWTTALLGSRARAKRDQILAANESLDQKFRQSNRDLQIVVEDLRHEVQRRERAQADLEYQNMLLDGLMDAIPDNIYFKDTEGRYLRINRAKAMRSGLASAELAQGKTDFDFFQPEHASSAYEVEQRIMQTGKPLIDHEEKLIWPDGRASWVSATKVPLKRPDGTIIGTLGISRDITSHYEISQALQLERDRLRTLIDHLPDYVFIKDAAGRFVTLNRAHYELFGCQSEEEIFGKTDFDFSPPELAAQYYADDQEVIRHGVTLTSREEEVVAADGDHRWVLTTKVPLHAPDGKVIGLVGIARDITKRKQAEQELKSAKEAAEVANRAKSEFLANMSHEIRTPMNAIIGMTELVLDTGLAAQQRDYLDTVLNSAESLMGIINDILDFSKIESGRLEIEQYPIDIREWFGDSIKPLAVRAHAKKLELACHIAPDVPPYVRGDGLRLRQIIVNLLGNAIKFTRAGEVVLDVQRETDERGGAMLHIRVSDTGIGISREQQSRIFEAFEQADMSTTRDYGGTGLGLAISSRLVTLMNGEIWVESELGEGSTFHILVPYGEVAPEEVPRNKQDLSALSGLRILVVDDNATNRRILEEMCRNWGMRPSVVSGAVMAMAELNAAVRRGEPYELVISDVAMPEVDGFSLAKQISQNESLGTIVVMMLSSLDRDQDIARCQEMGIRNYLTKPIKQSDLFDAIASVLDLSVNPSENVSSATQNFPRVQPMQVLLAEDSLANRKLAIGLLSRWGHEVSIATNGREAVEAMQSRTFDLVLMDVQMPEMDGLTATRQIRELEAAGSIRPCPIIALTAHAMKGDRERCLEAGMDNYITKPIRPFDLASVLAHYGEPLEAAEEPARPSEVPVVKPPMPTTAAGNGVHLNWSTLLHHVQDDEALAVDVAQAFLQETPRLLTDLGAALTAENASRAKLAAHTLKGSLRTLGAPSFERAAGLEIAASASDWAKGRELFVQFHVEVAEVLKELQSRLRDLPSESFSI
ncbi:hybrid sensor histidine kinase/response regulator [Planctomicrobium piriforme]|uniref:hybrid sensor histidine kinase/response regulator n=1 Tax=Planctomicrobium piriforme TaxID=1576369 RepID=UPI0015870EFB|nr:response regulator [Planctomicrobium piriforme]